MSAARSAALPSAPPRATRSLTEEAPGRLLPGTDAPVLVAHRGASGYRPEHAGRRALHTVDGYLVRGWFVEQLTLEQVRELRVVERFPHLRHGGVAYNGLLAVPTLQEVLELPVIVVSDDLRTLERVRELDCRVREAHAAGLVVIPWVFRAENVFLPEELRLGEDDSRLGRAADEIRAFLAAGVDGFCTDHTDRGVAGPPPWRARRERRRRAVREQGARTARRRSVVRSLARR